MGINEGTSLMSGLIIFSILGFMAQTTGKDISQVADSGPGLIFIAVPNAMAELPFSNFWNVAFFVMILFVGFDSHVNFFYQIINHCYMNSSLTLNLL